MRKTIVIIVTAVVVLFGTLTVVTPAQATKGDNRANVCTLREYRAIKNNMTYRQVKRILDGKGRRTFYSVSPWGSLMDREWGPKNYRRNARECNIFFDRPDNEGPWRVYYKSYSGPDQFLSRYWG